MYTVVCIVRTLGVNSPADQQINQHRLQISTIIVHIYTQLRLFKIKLYLGCLLRNISLLNV